jgi:predicted pyridoxine 5'-phosphate oxidase superfamily flavin-nucleotide-binding protein
MKRYSDIAFTPAVQDCQIEHGSYEHYQGAAAAPPPEGLGPDEVAFLTERDSIYLASVGENGWPYVQHRGGAPGFVTVVDPTHVAWVERPGTKQYVSTGNLVNDDRIAIIAVDYANRRRLKLYGHARFDPKPDAAALEQIPHTGRVEGLMTIEVVAYSWNCPKFITPRYTAEQVRSITDPLMEKIQRLEDELARLSPSASA